MPQPFADDDDDDNLWGEGFADSSIRTLFPLWACTNICTGISSIGADTHTHTTNCLQYLLFATATVDNDETAT